MSTRVRAVRVVSATDEPEQLPMPAQAAELVEVEVLPAEPCTSHRQSPSLPRLPSRFCFPKSSASQCSVTNIYCHMPETRHIAAAGSGSQASLPGTRLDWKLQPDGRLEVRVGPALTEEEEAKQAKDKDATKKADIEEKKDGSPAAATPEAPAGASTSAQPSGGGGSKAESIKPDRTWSFKLGPRAPGTRILGRLLRNTLPQRRRRRHHHHDHCQPPREGSCSRSTRGPAAAGPSSRRWSSAMAAKDLRSRQLPRALSR
ncbi:uncharacterized protein LOC125944130 [Dermacentor silvarum]|uniref:uncharacterized protein LOC125944130 n=1 Tax=Dermacentor silvarum TaxID=543639 RepID=UPI0021010242|nr:uncharacterized protein LOC125944130 [Dermacentor silvarum]